MRFFKSVCLVLLCNLSIIVLAEQISSARVVLINPTEPGNSFWDLVTHVAQDAAEDLGLTLTVRYTYQNRFKHREHLNQILAMQPRPDYVLLMVEPQTGLESIQKLDAAGVHIIVFNTPPLEDTEKVLGRPGERFPHWLLTLGPDDEAVGYELAKTLSVKAGGKGSMVALAGRRKEEASDARIRGLESAMANESIPLRQVIQSDWTAEDGHFKTKGLISRYPDLSAVWCASDRLATGAVNAVKAAGRTPGRDIHIGGVDWTLEGLLMTSSGEMSVNLGGHFLEPGWVLAMIADHHNGLDFPLPKDSRYAMAGLSPAQAGAMYRLLQSGEWRQFDFAVFSRAKYPNGHPCFMSVACMVESLAQLPSGVAR